MKSATLYIFIAFCIYFTDNSINAKVQVRLGSSYAQIQNPNTIFQGIISKSRDGRDYNAFLGIRYAKVPVRFRPPEPLPTKSRTNLTISPANQFGARCPQKFWATQEILGDEDCLFLNIFVPPADSESESEDNDVNFPVMLYIHGGRYTDGEGETYGPDYFMDEDVILITINYRLGAFGFLSTGDSEVPGNMGLRDQALAIKWIHDNIAAFGGDPERITIFGESAGAASVHLQMFWPENKGRFSRAISQSGTATCGWGIQQTFEANEHTTKLGSILGCDREGRTSKKFVECLQSKDWKDIVKIQSKLSKWLTDRTIPFGPVVESWNKNEEPENGPFLGQTPEFLIREGKYINVPWMVGINEDEGHQIQSAFILKNQKLISELNEKWNDIAPSTFLFGNFLKNPKDSDAISAKVRKFYFNNKVIDETMRENLTNLYSDVIFVHGTKMAVENMSKSKVYLYLLTYKGEFSCTSLMEIKEYLGVTHADDLQYLFFTKKYGPKEGLPKGSKSEKFSKNLVKLWASFAENGSPEETWGTAAGSWPAVEIEKQSGKSSVKNWYILDFDTSLGHNLFEDRMKFWDEMVEQYFVKKDIGEKSSTFAHRTEL